MKVINEERYERRKLLFNGILEFDLHLSSFCIRATLGCRVLLSALTYNEVSSRNLGKVLAIIINQSVKEVLSSHSRISNCEIGMWASTNLLCLEIGNK